MNCEPEWTDHVAFKPERWLNEKFNISEKYHIPFAVEESLMDNCGAVFKMCKFLGCGSSLRTFKRCHEINGL